MEEVPNKISLMYVGKNPDVLSSLKDKDLEFKVVHYENGLQAIDHLRKNNDIHAIVAEVFLPGIEGYELGVHLKQRLGLWKTPFILIGFENDSSYREKLFKNKSVFDDLYVYPVAIGKLLTRIRFLIWYLNRIEEPENAMATQRDYKIPLLKRFFDILVSTVAITILSPVFLIVAVAIKLESKGSVVYKSKRVGTG